MTQGAAIKRSILLISLLSLIVVAILIFRSRNDSMQPRDLTRLIDRADKVVVLQRPCGGCGVLFESSDRRDLDTLKASLRVEMPERHLHCMCDGTPAIFLYANGEKIGEITNHHTMLIRCSLWESDARLVDAQAFLKWFDDRNIPGPRREYEAGLERDKKWQADERKWVGAMPAALKPLWPAIDPLNPDLNPLRKALAEQLPEKTDRILALFSWYGSGAGPWSGFPSYEGVAEKMLLDYTTVDLLSAIENKELTEAQTEGVARLFGGWAFSHRPNDDQLLSAELRTRLLKHSLRNADDDKRGRAQRAFGEQ